MEVFFFITGLFFGSFLHVVVERIPKKLSIIFPPSHCPQCRHHLSWYDLIPLLSYTMLKGKCRYCNTPVSLDYPFMELLTAVVFTLTYILTRDQGFLTVLYYLAIQSIFIIVLFTDFKYGIIPVYPLVFGCMLVFAYLAYSASLPLVVEHMLSSLGAFAFFLFLFLITKGRGMGMGDVILVIFLGLFVGFPGIVLALYIAFLTGAIVSLILIAIGSKKIRHDTIPFGPFLITGTFIATFWTEALIQATTMFLLR